MARPAGPVGHGRIPQPVMRPALVVDRLPRPVERFETEPTPTELGGDSHRVVPSRGGRLPYLAQQRQHTWRVATIGAEGLPGIAQIKGRTLVTSNHFAAKERPQPGDEV